MNSAAFGYQSLLIDLFGENKLTLSEFSTGQSNFQDFAAGKTRHSKESIEKQSIRVNIERA